MTIRIGEHPGSDFSNPIGLLTDCHRRIEKFLNVLHTVAHMGPDVALDEEHRHAFEIALRYFRESAPKHTADEEESLFPRMQTHVGTESTAISDRINTLNADHRLLNGSHEEVDRLGRLWLANGFLKSEDRSRLVRIIQDLKDVYQRHIAIEEEDIFPMARRLLRAEDLQLIGKQMAARRSLPLA
jgi:hemerythrin-like domain-containing protein